MKWFRSKFITYILFAAIFIAPVTCVSMASAENAVVEDDVQNIVQTIKTFAEQGILQKKLIETLFVLLLCNVFMFVLISVINKSVRDIKARYVVRKNIVYITSGIMIVVILFIWIQNINSITIFLGVASAGLALALQEVIMCIAGWLLILIRRPFEVGDRIEMNGIKGDIIDIRLFQVSMLEIGNWVAADQSTGRIVNIPNSFVFKSSNFNYSRGFEFIWNEIPILVTFESNWEKGREIILKRATEMAEGMEERMRRKIDVMRNRYMIYYGKLTPIVYVKIEDSGVLLTLRYLTEAKKRRLTENQLSESILRDFDAEPNVNFAYPTWRVVKE